MMDEHTETFARLFLIAWPADLSSHMLRAWLPAPLAVGVCLFVLMSLVYWVPRKPSSWTLRGWTVFSLCAAVAASALAALIPAIA